MNAVPRTLVIGAGPAGLTAASQLQVAGHEVVVLEKEPTVGGKCKTVSVDGKAYDVGANLITPRYRRLYERIDALGVELAQPPPRQVVNLTDEVLPSVAEGPLIQKLLIRGGAGLYAAARGLTGVDRPGLANLPRGVSQPFKTWLERHGLAPFREIFAQLFVAYGYGLMDDLPAAYALKFFDPIHLRTAVQTVLGQDVSTTRMVQGGFQTIWQSLVEAEGLDIRAEVRIESVRRSPRGVLAFWEDADDRGHQDTFDSVVLACPLPATRAFLDTSPAEERLFAQIRHTQYFVTVMRARGLPDESTFLYPYSRKLIPGYPTVFYAPHPGTGVYVSYAYGDSELTEADVHARAAEVMAELDGTIEEVLHTERWLYFPHVSTNAMEAGFYDDLDALQGDWHTWYVGELLSFPLVELVMEHAEATVDRMLKGRG